MIKNIIILFWFFVGASNCFGKTDFDSTTSKYSYSVNLEKRISILTAYNFWGSHFGELGLAVNQYGSIGYHPAAWAYFISNEMKIDDKLLIGPKVGMWMSGEGMALGLNLIYYTDFEQSSLRIRPEIGIGFGKWKFVYGYNIPFTNRNFEGVNRSNIGIALMFGIKKLRKVQQ